MPQRDAGAKSDRLMTVIKCACWGALLLIGAMALASYLLLHRMITDQQREQDVLSLVSTQRTLSQRIVFLANAARGAPEAERPALAASLTAATSEFEANYVRLLDGLDPSADNSADTADGTVENILYGSPYHLDFFSVNLSAHGARFASAIENEAASAGSGASRTSYLDGLERSQLDARVANSTLEGYSVLREHLAKQSESRLARMLVLHRVLFVATLCLLALVAVFIFRPMAAAIRRRTHDLTEARNAMAFLAVHDSLTGLHNRAFLSDHLPALLKAAERRGERLAVVQIDLDRFKLINDTLGHAAGDAVLVATAARMRATCRPSDICVRLGGDEFILILGDAGTAEEVETLTRNMLSRLNSPISHAGATIGVGASAGIALYPADGETAADLVVHADLALYDAKKRGGSACSVFSGALRRELESRKALETDIRTAIREASFEAFFQPQVSLATGGVTGVEALMRWRHPTRGIVSPGEFIPVAEKCGLMPQIGRIVIGKAIARAGEWHRAGLGFGRLAVNASGSELQSESFHDSLAAALRQAGLPPQKLSVEIVESVIIDDERTGIAARLRALRETGVSLELDDFGTGYASLLHVDPQAIDRLKIDRRFVQNIDGNPGNANIVRAVLDLARSLGIGVIAEGAESAAELDALKALGCEEVQGYAVAFPMPATAAGDWLAAHAARLADKPEAAGTKARGALSAQLS